MYKWPLIFKKEDWSVGGPSCHALSTSLPYNKAMRDWAFEWEGPGIATGFINVHVTRGRLSMTWDERRGDVHKGSTWRILSDASDYAPYENKLLSETLSLFN